MGRAPSARESGSLDWVGRAMAGRGALLVRGRASCGHPGVGQGSLALGISPPVERKLWKKRREQGSQRGERVGGRHDEGEGVGFMLLLV